MLALKVDAPALCALEHVNAADVPIGLTYRDFAP